MAQKSQRPNIVYIMSDDHAKHALSCFGSQINKTPNIDRIANEGARFENCFCTNAICSPSRASVLTGLYSHKNGVKTLDDKFDGRQQTFPKLLKSSGYQTAMVGKWHLGHGGHADPTGFDYWNILPEQGAYHNPLFIENGEEKQYSGYVTDILTDISIDWLEQRNEDQPFLLMCQHKAPHRDWQPDEQYKDMYEDVTIPEPPSFHDDYQGKSYAANSALMRMEDLQPRDLKIPIPEGLTPEEEKSWRYQRYIKEYLRCVASMDDNIGRLLDYLEKEGIADNTIVVYTADHGFFLGDHGFFDKRFMYEQSLRIPLVMKYPKEIPAGTVSDSMVLNVDFAPTLLDYAGVEYPEPMDGRSFKPILEGDQLPDWRTSMYYRYWMHLGGGHRVCANYGIRTERYKLIYYYGEALDATGAVDESTPKDWELFDLEVDPNEMQNVYDSPDYADIVSQLKAELAALQEKLDDTAYVHQ